jgi:4'-phosphopantetheinyl transferase
MELYLCNINQFQDLSGREFILPERRERMQYYLLWQDKARCLVAGLMLRNLLGVVDSVQLTCNAYGKPYLKNSGIYFNLSHSGDYVVLGKSESEIGADIERIVPYSDEVAQKCFTPKEYEWMQNQRSLRAFYILWTAKESVMKATGRGFSLPPERFCVLPPDGSPRIMQGETWSFNWRAVDDHMVCTAVRQHPQPVTVRILERGDLLAHL